MQELVDHYSKPKVWQDLFHRALQAAVITFATALVGHGVSKILNKK